MGIMDGINLRVEEFHKDYGRNQVIRITIMSSIRSPKKKSNSNFDELFMTIINPTQSSKDSTYKFAFARFLIEYSTNSNQINVKFSTIAEYFLKYYWVQECRSKLNQSSFKVMKSGEKKVKKTIISKIITDEFGGDIYPEGYNEIAGKYPSKIKKCINEIEKKCFQDVTYAFQYVKEGNQTLDAAPIFFEYYVTGYKKRSKRSTDKPLIDLKRGIKIDSKAMGFFKKHHAFLEKVVILEWVRFIEKFNVGVPALIDKVEGNKEKRSNLSKERTILYKYFKNCFYCGDELNPKKDPKNPKKDTEVEHVIPFSFMREDEMWNFVLVCKECNCSKLGSLPPKNFLECLFDRNKKYLETIVELKKSLDKLGNDPERIINNHYDRAVDIGFTVFDDFKKSNMNLCN
jgi:5-methylcytosine-specific restriction endonuclease McrA